MSMCYICGQTETIPFKCNYCQELFCNVHRNPINHFCPFLETYDKKKKDMLIGNDSQKYGFQSSSSFFKTFLRIIAIKSSRTELFHLSLATILVTAVGLSLSGYRYISWQFLAIFVCAFLVHEFAHKFLAQYYGSWAEFRAQTWGLIITAISALPFMPFKFIAPGAVMVGLSDRKKFGR